MDPRSVDKLRGEHSVWKFEKVRTSGCRDSDLLNLSTDRVSISECVVRVAYLQCFDVWPPSPIHNKLPNDGDSGSFNIVQSITSISLLLWKLWRTYQTPYGEEALDYGYNLAWEH